MPRVATNTGESVVWARSVLQARYWVLRDLGLAGRQAARASKGIERFSAALLACGQAPSDYPRLIATRGLGGRPRQDDEASRRRRAWYRELRDLGLRSAEASYSSVSRRRFVRAKNELREQRR